MLRYDDNLAIYFFPEWILKPCTKCFHYNQCSIVTFYFASSLITFKIECEELFLTDQNQKKVEKIIKSLRYIYKQAAHPYYYYFYSPFIQNWSKDYPWLPSSLLFSNAENKKQIWLVSNKKQVALFELVLQLKNPLISSPWRWEMK